MPFVLYIRQLLEKKAITIAILLIAIISRVLQNLFFFNIRSDASYQILATDHFIHGHGISLAKVLPQNLSNITYEPLTNWPPGFSILILPFFALFNHDYVAAGLILFILN